MRRGESLAGLALACLGIGLPFLGVPKWLAIVLVGIGALLLVAAFAIPLVGRYFVISRRDDVVISGVAGISARLREPRRDLADELEDYASRLADFIDARNAEIPGVRGTGGLMVSQKLKDVQEAAERRAAHNRATMATYFREWRTAGMRLLREDEARKVGSEKFMEIAHAPGNVRELAAVPSRVYLTIAQRLRKIQRDRAVDEEQRRSGRVKTWVPVDEPDEPQEPKAS